MCSRSRLGKFLACKALKAESGEHRPASTEWDQDVPVGFWCAVPLRQVSGKVFGKWSALRIAT